MEKKPCPFCQELHSPRTSEFYEAVGRKIGCDNRILMESDHWYVVPTMGCLTVGYVLLVAKTHAPSLSSLPREQIEDMLALKQRVQETLFRQLGLDCLSFEHGTASPLTKGANSVDHVHIHVLPYGQPIWQQLSPEVYLKKAAHVDSYQALLKLWEADPPDSYLLFQDTDGQIYYIRDASAMPSQLFRQALAPHLLADQWNWRKESYAANMAKTMALFHEVV